MQTLQEKASEWSGVAPSDAFAIDANNVFKALGGDIKPFVDLSTNFYNRVYDDEEEWFRSIFAGSRKEDAIRNQYEFFVQRMGGPPLYSQRKARGKEESTSRKEKSIALMSKFYEEQELDEGEENMNQGEIEDELALLSIHFMALLKKRAERMKDQMYDGKFRMNKSKSSYADFMEKKDKEEEPTCYKCNLPRHYKSIAIIRREDKDE